MPGEIFPNIASTFWDTDSTSHVFPPRMMPDWDGEYLAFIPDLFNKLPPTGSWHLKTTNRVAPRDKDQVALQDNGQFQPRRRFGHMYA
jgi:hypothetical protein